MAFSADDALKVARGFLREAASRHRIRRAFLFGSCVWGQPTAYSDIDLAVGLEAAADTETQDFGEAFELFHEAQEYSSALEVVCFTLEEFQDETSTLVRRIKKDGWEMRLEENSLRSYP